MDLTPMVDKMSDMARERRPERLGDWRDEKGLLHCGICNAPLEHLISIKEEEKNISPNLSAEQRQRVVETMNFLRGRKVSCVCNCTKTSREEIDKKKIYDEKMDRIFHAFGNSVHLQHTNFTKDNFSKPNVTKTLDRYINKFDDIRSKGLCIILSGEKDSGKTFFSICVANAILDRGYFVSYSNIYKILSNITPYVTYQHIINMELFANLVIIEDVNEDCFEQKQYQVLVAYIKTLQSKGIPIIITTRFSGEHLNKITDICKNTSIIKVE